MSKKRGALKSRRSFAIAQIKIPVFIFGQSPKLNQPVTEISLQAALQWHADGAGMCIGDGSGRYFVLGRVIQRQQLVERGDGTATVHGWEELAGPISGKIRLRGRSGVSLLWRYLKAEPEAIEAVHSFGKAVVIASGTRKAASSQRCSLSA